MTVILNALTSWNSDKICNIGHLHLGMALMCQYEKDEQINWREAWSRARYKKN